MNHSGSTYQRLCDFARETQLLASVSALLEWDQQTNLPPAATAYRAEQISYLAGQLHERNTDPRLGDWLSELADSQLASDPHSVAGATIRELKYRFEKKRKLPVGLVKRLAAECSIGQNVWVEARKLDDFDKFAPNLKEILTLKREEAEAIGGAECPYDVLLDDFEPGATTREVAAVLGQLKEQLIPLIAEITSRPTQVDSSLLNRRFPEPRQRAFVTHATTAVGFDYERGRLDVAQHPFCTELGPNDCRITIRYQDNYFSSAFFGCLHEAGHGMYEQGLPSEHYGLPPGSYCSLGIHESQSRLWENLVGRSQGFWSHFYADAQRYFPDALSDIDERSFYQAVNEVRPSLIRVEADEATYDLHIIIRFELEQALLDKSLTVDDLPAAWNEKYQQYLGVRPESNAVGVLQDIHWSAGLIGYFPTYSLGNIYASQFFEKAREQIGDLQTQFAAGQFEPLLTWLRSNIYQVGGRWRASELVQRITGQKVDYQPIMNHLRQKLTPIYQL